MNDRLIVLGTGNANVTHCYNTCFIIETAEGLLLCDAGGGNGIMQQLEKKNIGWERIHHLILTHAHTDHLLGAVWVLRMISTCMNNGKYVAAICAAPSILGHKGILDGKKATCYAGFETQLGNAEISTENVCVCENIITSKGPGTSMEFALKLVEVLISKERRDILASSLML